MAHQQSLLDAAKQERTLQACRDAPASSEGTCREATKPVSSIASHLSRLPRLCRASSRMASSASSAEAPPAITATAAITPKTSVMTTQRPKKVTESKRLMSDPLTGRRKTTVASARVCSEFDARYIKGASIGTGSTASVYRVRPRGPSDVVANASNDEEKSHTWLACKDIPLYREGSNHRRRPCQMTTAKEASEELELMMAIRHPNLVELHDYVLEEDSCKLIMGLLSGGELGALIEERGSLPEEDAKEIITGILRGVQHLHENGIVHRDLKLQNIMLKDGMSNAVKIVDLGLAKKLYQSEETEVLSENTICGSPIYMAPEVVSPTSLAHCGKAMSRYGLSADLWSCGVILYFMLAGHPPFNLDNGIYNLFRQIRSGDYSLTADPAWEMVTAEAADLVRCLMAVDPAKRLTSTQALHHPWLLSK